jgi:hypothetical protein
MFPAVILGEKCAKRAGNSLLAYSR